MSYEIVYDRQFIKTRDDKFIPMTLWGSNNCTETYTTGVERRVRDWTPICHGILTEDELLQYWKDYMDRHMKDYEVGKENILWGMGLRIGGKNSYDDMLNWLKTSMKKAITFDQLKEMGYSLTLEGYHNYSDRSEVKNGYEPFELYTNDEDEFIEKYNYAKGNYGGLWIRANWSEKFGKWTRQRYFPRARKNQNKELKEVPKYYTIKVTTESHGEMYLAKHTARSTKMAYSPYKRYATEKEAQRLVDRYNKKYGPRKTYKVEEINSPTRIFV